MLHKPDISRVSDSSGMNCFIIIPIVLHYKFPMILLDFFMLRYVKVK